MTQTPPSLEVLAERAEAIFLSTIYEWVEDFTEWGLVIEEKNYALPPRVPTVFGDLVRIGERSFAGVRQALYSFHCHQKPVIHQNPFPDALLCYIYIPRMKPPSISLSDS